MFDNEQHHWIGVTPDPGKQWGFIYCITHLPTGKKYIGKKAYRKSAGPKPKTKPRSLKLKTFREWHWKENDWRYYSGSSKYLTEFKKGTKKLDWEHEILCHADNSMDLHYQEIEYLVWNRVLTLVDEDGEYVFFNRSVPGIKFRPPETHTEATRDKLAKAKELDTPCIKCGGTDWKIRKKYGNGRQQRECRTCINNYQREWHRKYRANKKKETQDVANTK